MMFQNHSQPRMRKNVIRRKNYTRKCCLPVLGFWTCSRPGPVVSEIYPRKNSKTKSRPNSVSASVQTPCSNENRHSKVSWNSQVDVHYIDSKMQIGKSQKAPLQDIRKNCLEDMKNVVHLKIKIPKDVLNLNSDEEAPTSMRLENEWKLFNAADNGKKNETGKRTSATPSYSLAIPVRDQNEVNQNSPTSPDQTWLTQSNFESSKAGHKMQDKVDSDEPQGDVNTVVGGFNVVQTARGSVVSETVGIPVKQPGKSSCESKGCSCKGGTKNDENIEKLRQSFNMTESELSMLEKNVHNSAEPTELKIQTDYGSVNVIAHNADCTCEICEKFGAHDESHRKHSGRSDSAAVISKKIIRVYYNGDYRNIVTHTEECGCDICTSIEEHSYKFNGQRASVVSTNQGDLHVENRGVCGCKNCKTVAMGPHAVNVETMLSRTTSNLLDLCYYSDATIPSIRSFPREFLTTTDDQITSVTSPPSINSSDLSDPSYSESNSIVNMNRRNHAGNQYIDSDQTPTRPFDEIEYEKPTKESRPAKCNDCENGSLHVSKKTRNRIYDALKPCTVKSTPALHDKHKKECENRPSTCKGSRGETTHDKVQQSTGFKSIDVKSKNVDISPKRDTMTDPFGYLAGQNITLEDLIKDLIRGQPEMQKDKVYTVTLGEAHNKPYTKIQIVDCSQPRTPKKREEKVYDVKMPFSNGDGSNSNVFFIKPLPSASRTHSAELIQNDDADPHSSAKNQSLSNPECARDVIQHYPSTMFATSQNEDRFDQIHGSRVMGSACAPRSELPKKAVKLTISFGKKVISFFRQKSKKKISSQTVLAGQNISNDTPQSTKTFAVSRRSERPLQCMEVLQIEVTPRYFALDTNDKKEGTFGRCKTIPISCIAENTDPQILTTEPINKKYC